MSRTNPQPRLARLAAIAAIVVLAAGCAASSKPATGTAPRLAPNSHAAFLASVNQICGRAVAAHAGHPFPLTDFDPEHPKPQQLPMVGNYFARYGGLLQITVGLHKLTPPASDAPAWHRLLSDADLLRDNAERQIAAARAQDVATFVTTVHIAARLTGELDNDGARFGFTGTSTCSQVFG